MGAHASAKGVPKLPNKTILVPLKVSGLRIRNSMLGVAETKPLNIVVIKEYCPNSRRKKKNPFMSFPKFGFALKDRLLFLGSGPRCFHWETPPTVLFLQQEFGFPKSLLRPPGTGESDEAAPVH